MEPLWANLINSDWRDHLGSGRREDRIGNDVWLAGFLAQAGWPGDPLPGRAGRERLRRLRRTLRRIVEAVRGGRKAAEDDIALLNAVVSKAGPVRRLEQRDGAWQVRKAWKAEGVVRVEAQVASSFASMLAEGDPTRLKVCANPDCGWVMYDESHGRTRRWCDASECGNLIKVRRFRERHKDRR